MGEKIKNPVICKWGNFIKIKKNLAMIVISRFPLFKHIFEHNDNQKYMTYEGCQLKLIKSRIFVCKKIDCC